MEIDYVDHFKITILEISFKTTISQIIFWWFKFPIQNYITEW